MNANQVKFLQYMRYYETCVLISSASVLLCVFGTRNAVGAFLSEILFPITFWLSLAGGTVFLTKADKCRRILEKAEKKRLRGRPGIISFGQTQEGKIADRVCVTVFAALVICTRTRIGIHVLQFILMSILFLSFQLHCLCNGLNYRYRKKLEKKERKESDAKSKEQPYSARSVRHSGPGSDHQPASVTQWRCPFGFRSNRQRCDRESGGQQYTEN